MGDWFVLALVALLCMGLQRFLYKVSAERRCNSAWTTFAFMATVASLSSLMVVILPAPVGPIKILMLLAAINSGAFLAGTLTHMEALKNVSATVAYPLIRLNVVVAVIFSVLFFKDRLSIYQITGMLLAVAVILILTIDFKAKHSSNRNIKRGLVFVSISLFAGALALISSKFAALYTDAMAFMAVSYTISTVLAFGLRKKMQMPDANANPKEALIIGGVMGVINFGGYYAFLKALSVGPLSAIACITGMHFVIAIVLSALIYKEKVTPSGIVGTLLTVASILLLRLR